MNILKKKNTSASLFNKQKHTPEFIVKQTKIKQSILNKLSRAIKEVQYQFTNKDPSIKEGGFIGDGRSSQLMCTAFEEVLKHGLKSGWFGQGTPTFWPIVLKISRKEATEFIGRLQHAQSDSAKCRGWIRLAVNECSLASYVNVICQDSSILSYYETYSFVRDPEMTSTLTDLLAGVSQIPFNLTVDVASLEFDSAPEVHSDLPLRMRDPYQTRAMMDTPPAVAHKASGKERHKKARTKAGHKSPRDGGSLSATPSGSTQSLDDRASVSGSSVDEGDGASEGIPEGMPSGSVLEGGGMLAADDSSDVNYEYCSDLEAESLDQDCSSPDSKIDWDYWKNKLGEEQLHMPSTNEPHVEDITLTDEVDVETTLKEQATGRTESLTNLAEEIIDQEKVGVEGVGSLHGGSGSEEVLPSRQSPIGSSNHSDGEEREMAAGLEYDRQETVVELKGPQDILMETRNDQNTLVEGKDYQNTQMEASNRQSVGSECTDEQTMIMAAKDRQDTLVEEEFASVCESIVKNEDNGRHDTLVGVASPSHHSPTGTLTGSVSLTASVNPFDPAAPLPVEPSPGNHGANPFWSESPPTGTFSVAAQPHVDQEPKVSLNPFHSSDNLTDTTPSGHTHTTSTNPFQEDFNSVFGGSTPPRSPSPQAPPTSLMTPPSPTFHKPSGTLSMNSDLSPPLQHLNMFSADSFAIPPPPLRSPESSNHGTPSHSQLTEPINKRPPSSSSSENSAPSRSVATDDLESYSSSSIDISFADYAHLQLDHQQPHPLNQQLRSPEEDYFKPEVNMVDVQLTLDRLKLDLVKGEEEDESLKDAMRRKIVELQMQLQQLRDQQEEKLHLRDASVKELYGHQLLEQRQRTGMVYRMCEGCGKRIRGLIRPWFMCKLCGFSYHKKCLVCVDRVCSASQSSSNTLDEFQTYILEVCPEKGLSRQHFRCASCNVSLIGTITLTRLCDYCGQYFCPNCHRNDEAVIPARVIHNWDFTTKKVCCKCCDTLERLSRKPMLRIQPLNNLLYTYVQNLSIIESLRKDLIVMKKYFLECPSAKETHILKRLDEFPHFKDGAKRFSLADLMGIHDDSLLPRLRLIHQEFSTHIKRECAVCSNRGFSCVLCKSDEVLYPFDKRCRQCPKCHSLFHRNCYTEMTTCPKCSRVRTHRKPAY